MGKRNGAFTEALAISQMVDSKETDKLWNQFDPYQKAYDKAMDEHSVVFVDAEAGTGKTTGAVRKALVMLRGGLISKIVYVRYPDDESQALGFLTGDKGQKESGFMIPFYDAMSECGIPPDAVDKMEERGVVEMTSDIHMRGRNLKGTFVIIDEAQNAKAIGKLQKVLTRIHDRKGKAVVVGHSGQQDGKVQTYTKFRLTAFQVFRYHMTKKPWATTAKLVNNYRGEISKHADRVQESVTELEGMGELPACF